MKDRLTELLNEAVSLGQGGNETDLYTDGDGVWHCQIIGGMLSIRLGETDGEYEGFGKTPIEAVENLIDNYKSGKRAR